MGQKEKLIRKLKSIPRDFTFDEAESLLGYLNTTEPIKGKPVALGLCLQAMNMMQRFCYINHIQG